MDEGAPQGAITTKAPKASYKELGLTKDDLLKMYSKMVLARTLDERIIQLNRQGKAAIFASCQGHEAAHAACVWALRPGHDLFYLYYRDLPVVIALGMTPKELLLAFMAKAGEPLSGARQFPLHGTYPKYNIVSLSNVVATQIPQAVGAALASKMRGEDKVTIAFFGDGAASQGDCHEAMNFAGIHKLPVIFFCENNLYATSTPLKKQMAIEDIADRARGYGFPGVAIDGTDLLKVYQVTREAGERARSGGGPTLIEIKVERLMPHTSDDDDTRYRPKEELEEARKSRDPLPIYRNYLMTEGILTEATDKEFVDTAKREVNKATEFAESAPYPNTDDFYDHVYAAQGGA